MKKFMAAAAIILMIPGGAFAQEQAEAAPSSAGLGGLSAAEAAILITIGLGILGAAVSGGNSSGTN